MTEKLVHLEGVTLVDFLGVANDNIRTLEEAFPASKIISRGDQIHIQGSAEVVAKVHGILQTLLAHYHRYHLLTKEAVQHYVSEEGQPMPPSLKKGVITHGAGGTLVRARTANQEKLVTAVDTQDMVFATGPAGTGKTYIAVALAVRALKRKQVKKIILTRPVVEAGERLGYLPGDLEEKISPYLRPVYDALDDLLSPEKRKYYQENDIIELAPLAYMRGRTLRQAFVILDEAQNTTPTQMKLFLTRMGLHTKFVITGDTTQTDLPSAQRSGLAAAMDTLRSVSGIGFVHFDEQDVVRHPLVKRIIQAYQQ
ncbi:MAG: PhoH family protein [Bacteroidota bacterium]